MENMENIENVENIVKGKKKGKIWRTVLIIAGSVVGVAALLFALEGPVTKGIIGGKNFYKSHSILPSYSQLSKINDELEKNAIKSFEAKVRVEAGDDAGLNSSGQEFVKSLEVGVAGGVNDANDAIGMEVYLNQDGRRVLEADGKVTAEEMLVGIPQLIGRSFSFGRNDETAVLFDMIEQYFSMQDKTGITSEDTMKLLKEMEEAFINALDDKCFSFESYNLKKYGISGGKAMKITMGPKDFAKGLKAAVKVMEKSKTAEKMFEAYKDTPMGIITFSLSNGNNDYGIDKMYEGIYDALDEMRELDSDEKICFNTLYTGNGIVTAQVVGYELVILDEDKDEIGGIFFINAYKSGKGEIDIYLWNDDRFDRVFEITGEYKVKGSIITGEIEFSADDMSKGDRIWFEFEIDARKKSNMGLSTGTYMFAVSIGGETVKVELVVPEGEDYHKLTVVAANIGRLEIDYKVSEKGYESGLKKDSQTIDLYDVHENPNSYDDLKDELKSGLEKLAKDKFFTELEKHVGENFIDKILDAMEPAPVYDPYDWDDDDDWEYDDYDYDWDYDDWYWDDDMSDWYY